MINKTVEISDFYTPFNLNEEFLKDLKKELRYLKWKMVNDNINQTKI